MTITAAPDLPAILPSRPTSWRLHAPLIAGAVAVAISLLLEVIDLDPSIGNRRFHTAVETADAMVLVAVAAVLVGRLRADASRRNVLMVVAIVLLAIKNLYHAGVVMVVDLLSGSHVAVWATTFNGLVGASILAVAAVAPDRPIRRARPGRIVAAAAAVVVAMIVLAVVLEPALPSAFDNLPEEATEIGRLSGHPAKIVLDLATAGAYGVAAWGFGRRAARQDDEFLLWLSVGAAIASVAFLNYALYPSRFSQLLYGGEILWLGAITVLLYGAVREIANTEAELVRTAVLSERRRVARDLHDGVAQELAYIVSQASWYRRQPSERQPLDTILVAVERALEESRAAIAALSRPLNEPLPDALGNAASDVADRLGARVVLDLDPDVEVPPEWRVALTRIVREAVGNAVRHGGARRVNLELHAGPPVSLVVADDGNGFDPAAPRSTQSFGITGMRERTESLGGSFTLRSSVGGGTTVEIVLA